MTSLLRWSNWLDCKEIQPVHSEGDQSWVFFGRNDAKAETPVLWSPHVTSWLIGKDSDAGKDWGQEEKGTTVDEMAGRHHWLDGRESEWTPEVGDGQGGLACCDSWGRKESDTTELLNWTALNWGGALHCQELGKDFCGEDPETKQENYLIGCSLSICFIWERFIGCNWLSLYFDSYFRQKILPAISINNECCLPSSHQPLSPPPWALRGIQDGGNTKYWP